jgi:uridylate kinase
MSKIVISVGGSLICPDDIDIIFLKNFYKIITKQLKQNKKFILITGGGKIARNYQKAVQKITKVSNKELDWLGIQATKINAQLLLTIFKIFAHKKIITNPKEKINFKEKILIASGWKPGFSTDYDAVLLAKTYGSDTIINLTNIDYVYDKDPNKFKDAKPFKEISWKDYLKLIDQKWTPGMSAPFDPVASKLAQKFKFKVVILNGKKLKNLKNYLENRKFKGTIIY